jgi:predicted DCC family thiol-disulfide oxidoreductase YuxK
MNTWRIKVLYDGACPLCRREASIWQWLDRGRGRIALVDIASADFQAAEKPISRVQAMTEIHGILPTGTVVRGMEVFRRAYAAAGLGWVLAPTSWPLLRPLFDRAYRWFARNRQWLTGRSVPCTNACALPGDQATRRREWRRLHNPR